MFSLNDSMRYYLCPGATDMRKSFYTLGGLVTNVMKQDLRSGDVFIFINRKKDTIKLLNAEHGGLVLYIKKLEEGTFAIPKYDEATQSYPMQWRDLVMMVEGIRDDPRTRLKRLKMR
jgi:transposase